MVIDNNVLVNQYCQPLSLTIHRKDTLTTHFTYIFFDSGTKVRMEIVRMHKVLTQLFVSDKVHLKKVRTQKFIR